MDRQFYMALAATGKSFPIGADLVLREKPDHDAILLDGTRLGDVIIEAARRYGTPLALPLMDLTLEKEVMLSRLGIAAADAPTFHFDAAPSEEMVAKAAIGDVLDNPRIKATVDAIAHVAHTTDLLPIGMAIGPFSLMTKLLADPITAVYLAGSGIGADEEPDVLAVERLLHMATAVVIQNIEAQAKAGAKATFVCEPAANKVYISPNQMQSGSDVFERYAMAPNRAIRKRLGELGVDLIFHCCGELTDAMLKAFGTLDSAMISLGASRDLWHDAGIIPHHTVLYGNLPSKRFYAKDLTPDEVIRMSRELRDKVGATGHPYILGTECDVLSVPGSEGEIVSKVHAMMRV